MEQQCITKRHTSVSQKNFYTPEVFDNFSQRLRIFKLKFYTPIVRSDLHKTAKFFWITSNFCLHLPPDIATPAPHRAVKKTERWGAGVAICLERGADLHMAQLMPLPLPVFCFSKIQIGFTFLVPAHPGSPGKRAAKRVSSLSSNFYECYTKREHRLNLYVSLEKCEKNRWYLCNSVIGLPTVGTLMQNVSVKCYTAVKTFNCKNPRWRTTAIVIIEKSG